MRVSIMKLVSIKLIVIILMMFFHMNAFSTEKISRAKGMEKNKGQYKNKVDNKVLMLVKNASQLMDKSEKKKPSDQASYKLVKKFNEALGADYTNDINFSGESKKSFQNALMYSCIEEFNAIKDKKDILVTIVCMVALWNNEKSEEERFTEKDIYQLSQISLGSDRSGYDIIGKNASVNKITLSDLAKEFLDEYENDDISHVEITGKTVSLNIANVLRLVFKLIYDINNPRWIN